MEIERKFLVTSISPAIRRFEGSNIVQGYFPTTGSAMEIRLRRKDSQYYLTVKSRSGVRRIEEEIAISKSRFQTLWPLTRSARISKRRYKMPYESHTIEIDVYRGSHRGLVTAEVEFKNMADCSSFRPPDWFAREITGQKRYSNRKLAQNNGARRTGKRK